jgi:hypothetical protein
MWSENCKIRLYSCHEVGDSQAAERGSIRQFVACLPARTMSDTNKYTETINSDINLEYTAYKTIYNAVAIDGMNQI